MTALDEQSVVITGGAAGIGKAMVKQFIDEGAQVLIADIDEEAGTAAADELGCRFETCDVTDYEQVSAVVETAVDEYGGLDAIVNNAGFGSETSVGDMELEEWKAVLEINLDGVMHGTKAAIPYLIESEGCIINLGSIYGLVGGRGAASYSAAKGGVVNFTQQVAVDYASEGIRVNSICPGFVKTPMTEDLLESERFYEYVVHKTPMDRPADPEEIAPLAVFLASEKASYITGANIPIDGGWTAF